jgi:hypothetical protein
MQRIFRQKKYYCREYLEVVIDLAYIYPINTFFNTKKQSYLHLNGQSYGCGKKNAFYGRHCLSIESERR